MCYNQLMENTQLIIMALVGLAVLLFGYRIKKVGFFIAWFILGFNILTLLLPTLINLVPQINNDLWRTLLPIAGGLLMGLLGFTIEKFCVAGIVFVAVMTIAAKYFTTIIPDSQTLALAVSGLVAVFAAALAVRMMKPAIILATSAVGAYAVTVAVLQIWPNIDLGIFYWPIICGLILVGALFQFSSTKRIS